MSDSVVTFAEAVRAVLPHAAVKTFTPILESVQVFPDRVIATDRYTLAVAQHDYTSKGGEPFEPFVLPVACAKELVKMGTPAKIANLPGADAVEFTYSDGTVRRYVTQAGAYPDIERLFPDRTNTPATEVPMLALNVAHLAKFAPLALTTSCQRKRASADRPYTQLVWTFYGTTRPVLVTFGGWFRAMMVPLKPVE